MMLAAGLSAILLSTLSFSASATENIRFATQASYPPFEFMDSKNQITGFDIDLAKAICQEIKATCTFANQAFDSLIPSLKFKRIDAIIAGMDITPERQKQVTFTTPYYSNSAIFVAKKGAFATIDALKGKKVGTQNGTTHQKYMQEKRPGITIVPYDNYQNAELDLKNGRIDAVFGDTAVVNEWLKGNEQLAQLGEKITDANYFGIGLGIAVHKNNDVLVKQFNQALNALKQNGTYDKIYAKWFNQ